MRRSRCFVLDNFARTARFLLRQNQSVQLRLICIYVCPTSAHRGYWYEIFDARGKKAKSVSDSIGELLGWSDRFFIVMKGYWYDTYDEQGKKIKSISTSIGNFVSICADQFIVRKGSWLDTYDAFGKKISSRAAR